MMRLHTNFHREGGDSTLLQNYVSFRIATRRHIVEYHILKQQLSQYK